MSLDVREKLSAIELFQTHFKADLAKLAGEQAYRNEIKLLLQ
jgi:hypothetical protein